MRKNSYAFLALFMTTGTVFAQAPGSTATEDQQFLAEQAAGANQQATEFSPDNPYVDKTSHTGAHLKVPAGAEGFLRSGVFPDGQFPLSGMQKTAINASEVLVEGGVGTALMKFWHSDIGKKLAKAQRARDDADYKVKNSLIGNGMTPEEADRFALNAAKIAETNERIASLEAANAGNEVEARALLAELKETNEHLQAVMAKVTGGDVPARETVLKESAQKVADQQAVVDRITGKQTIEYINGLRKEVIAAQSTNHALLEKAAKTVSQTRSGVTKQAALLAEQETTEAAWAAIKRKSVSIAERGLGKRMIFGLGKLAADGYIVVDVASKGAAWIATGEVLKPFTAADLAREFVKRSQDN